MSIKKKKPLLSGPLTTLDLNQGLIGKSFYAMSSNHRTITIFLMLLFLTKVKGEKTYACLKKKVKTYFSFSNDTNHNLVSLNRDNKYKLTYILTGRAG